MVDLWFVQNLMLIGWGIFELKIAKLVGLLHDSILAHTILAHATAPPLIAMPMYRYWLLPIW
jgi:hypothetical protein